MNRSGLGHIRFFDFAIQFLCCIRENSQLPIPLKMSEEKIKGTLLLQEAMQDAEKLLAYASEYGIKLEKQHIKAIVNAKKSNVNNEWTSQDEIDFWVAFQVISHAVYPVTIDSLRATRTPRLEKPTNWWQRAVTLKNRSKVERSVVFYRRFALVTMAIMLVIQIYALIGTALMSKWNAGNMRMKEIEKRMQSLMLISSSDSGDRTARMEQQNLEIELDELGQELESGIQLLDDWLDATYDIWSKNSVETTKAVKENMSADMPPFAVNHTDASKNIVIIQRAKSLIVILNQYILPLLYGLLGGIAFVLRSIATETKLMTYTSTSKIKYGLRLHLGALAGLIIGFLWGDLQGKSFGMAETLSPLAVAFIAGYSVEFIFKMLDSLIGVTGKKTAEVTNVKYQEAMAESTNNISK